MSNTDREQILEYLKLAGFNSNKDKSVGTKEDCGYILEDSKITIIEYIYKEKDFTRRIITEIEGYIGILMYLKINFPL